MLIDNSKKLSTCGASSNRVLAINLENNFSEVDRTVAIVTEELSTLRVLFTSRNTSFDGGTSRESITNLIADCGACLWGDLAGQRPQLVGKPGLTPRQLPP